MKNSRIVANRGLTGSISCGSIIAKLAKTREREVMAYQYQYGYLTGQDGRKENQRRGIIPQNRDRSKHFLPENELPRRKFHGWTDAQDC